MLSIIIPTYNEEKYLPSLLESIRRQELNSYEIIIGDKGSRDKTRRIAKKFGCRLVDGETPGKAKNKGARAAKYDKLLFLDADIILPEGFLKIFLKKIENNNLDFACCRVEPISNNQNHRFVYMLKNLGVFIFPNHVSGQCLFVKKKLFNRTKGFYGSLLFGEEHELAKKLNRYGKGIFFVGMKVYNHPRRQEKEGTYRTLIRDIYSEIYRMFFGIPEKELFKKEYGHY